MGGAGSTSFKPVAPLIRRLKFERRNGDQYFYNGEARDFRDFVNLTEIHAVCGEGLRGWHGVSEDHSWPRGKEKVFMIVPDDGRMMRSIELDKMFDNALKEEYRRTDERNGSHGRSMDLNTRAVSSELIGT
ncbi:hypothetical protein C8A01DRAFT_18055 [Parachaetomium inaequale]|uniref:Uncharacterized protein n=1 Tax=Parachaetomium inaequale TaxID=2588326 RepID=A0AAN6PF39_9PEZI|nr:hypothetical protein C8A01DRAFT_18055 [Parachaetomium inaequale]